MTALTDPTGFTAVRSADGRFVVITHPDGTVKRLGGARAGRAAGVTVISRQPGVFVYSLRSDANAARSEAALAATDHIMRHAGHAFDVAAADVAVFLPVVP